MNQIETLLLKRNTELSGKSLGYEEKRDRLENAKNRFMALRACERKIKIGIAIKDALELPEIKGFVSKSDINALTENPTLLPNFIKSAVRAIQIQKQFCNK